jgi:hypothetical protein
MEPVETALLVIVIAVAFVLAMVVFAWVLPRMIPRALTKMTPYRDAKFAVQNSRKACEILGTPVEFGLPAGTERWGIPATVVLCIPVSGQSRSGVVYVTGSTRFLRWVYRQFELQVDGFDTVQLCPPLPSKVSSHVA